MTLGQRAARLLPKPIVDGARQWRHGESWAQRTAASAARRVSARLGLARGMGTALFGPPLRPRRAEVVDSFDARQFMEETAATLAAALDGLQFIRLPAGTKPAPTFVVAAADARAAIEAVRRHTGAQGWWVAAEVDEIVRPPRPLTEVTRLSGSESTLILFRYLAASNGQLLTNEQIGVRLELWHRTDGAYDQRRDGGRWQAGTLLASSPNRVTVGIEPDQWHESQAREGHLLAGSDLPHVLDVSEPIDVVYTWVDGSDPAWQQRQRAARNLERDTRHSGDALIPARFASHDELRYSLRSLEMFASWVRHIWVVTDQQAPDWLLRDHPRLTVVDHKEIFTDHTALPTFNSHAIESQLHHIDGLADKYLYLNDDVFFGGPVQPESFFFGNGIMKFFPSLTVIDQGAQQEYDLAATSAAKRNRQLIESTFSQTFTNKPRHTPIPQSRTVLYEMEGRFPEVFDTVMRSRFRNPADYSIPSSLAQYYAYATGRAVTGGIHYGYLNLSAPKADLRLQAWLRSRSLQCFCLNDTGDGLTEPGGRVPDLAGFLERYFPVPSGFEQAERED